MKGEDQSERQQGIEAAGLSFRYPGADFAIAVRELKIAPGEAVAITGPSGCGKSTLLRLLCGILQPDAGTIRLANSDLVSLPRSEQRELRLRKTGVVFQDFALLGYLTVEENILLPARLGGFADEAMRQRAAELAEAVQVSHRWGQPASRLSQGEQQRAAIARALVHQPAIVLADEPTAALDVIRRDLAGELLLSHARRQNAAVVVVTHDLELQSRLDRVVNFEELSA